MVSKMRLVLAQILAQTRQTSVRLIAQSLGSLEFKRIAVAGHGLLRAATISNARSRIDVPGLRYPPYDRNRLLREIVMPS
jgi:hypothetical protein